MNTAQRPEAYDAIVIGGGFYGCCLALRLRQHHERVLILEACSELLTQASAINQARVHHGYHYPRSLLTALRSSRNYAPFTTEFAGCISDEAQHLYAVARNASKTNAEQFQRLCQRIDAPLESASPRFRRVFDASLIEDVFVVREAVFDAAKLRLLLADRLDSAAVEVRCDSRVKDVHSQDDGLVVQSERAELWTRAVYSCVYSETNALLARSGLPLLPLKHELAELVIVRAPEEVAHLGITIVDGPFWSMLPYPGQGLHSLSHVRYTPRESWQDLVGHSHRGSHLKPDSRESNYPYMIRDATRYVPALARAEYIESLYTTKTVLSSNESDDGRPILYRQDYGLDGFSVILGSKIDNIYDALQATLKEQYDTLPA